MVLDCISKELGILEGLRGITDLQIDLLAPRLQLDDLCDLDCRLVQTELAHLFCLMGHFASRSDFHEVPALEKTHFRGYHDVEHALEGLCDFIISGVSSISLLEVSEILHEPRRTHVDQAQRVN